MFGGSVFGQDQFGQGPSPLAASVSLSITTAAEASSNAIIDTGSLAELPQGKGGGRYIDPYQSTPQKLTVRITSGAEASSRAVMGVRVPAVKIPGVSLAITSRTLPPSSRGTFRERLGMTVVSSIQVGSDSAFEETIHLTAVEYERMTDTLDDDEVMMLHEMAMA